MHINYVVNSPGTFVFIWRLIKGMLEQNTVKKIRIMKQSVIEELTTHFAPGQYEIKYGGTAPNAETFWPPTMPHGPWNSKNEGSEQLLGNISSYHDYFPAPNQEEKSEKSEKSGKSEKKKKKRRMGSDDTSETLTPITSNKPEEPELEVSGEELPKIIENSMEEGDSHLILAESNSYQNLDIEEPSSHHTHKKSKKSKKSRHRKRRHQPESEECENIQVNSLESYSMHDEHINKPVKKLSLAKARVTSESSKEIQDELYLSPDQDMQTDESNIYKNDPSKAYLKSELNTEYNISVLKSKGKSNSYSNLDSPRVITESQENYEERTGMLCGGCFSGKTMSCIVF